MGDAGETHDACAGGRADEIKEVPGEREVSEMVRAELRFKTIDRELSIRHHNPGIVDKQVKLGMFPVKLLAKVANRLEIGQVKQHCFEGYAAKIGGQRRDSGLGFVFAPHRHDNVRARLQ